MMCNFLKITRMTC